MIRSYAIGLMALGVIVSIGSMQGESATHYRDFRLGGDLASVSTVTGVAASDAKTIRTRPALLQEMVWRRPYAFNETAVDPVEQITFSFYNDQLFRLVVDYDRGRTEGMTDADMVEGISTMYGATVKPPLKTNRAPVAGDEDESGTRVAGWGNAEYAAVLYRLSYGSAFRMIVTSVRLNALARTAEAQAARMDERDAPQRERARQKKEADDERAAKATARLANKAAFRP
jgi:hypothetical protein